ncbi:EF-hand domain-containing protein [Ideonella azotifigens]|uniref:EF-hand domain-containing protein n=1 Tax=Ideonella azotifigens TaxID=513160 RepID=A0ABN1KJQ0_9BURK|nr:EF-hand domain-containing protein [Ideonella azotifigens]MCD2339467.1 EF-hand domain-containing protein [Ideonella azotifigens]
MNVSSATSNNSIWQMLTARAQANARSSATSSTGSAGGSTNTGTADATSSTTTSRPDGPPPPPSQFDMAMMSTAQFAGMGGMPPGGQGRHEDPMASLDSDGDGSVSSDEFGLDKSSDAAQALFKAIDSDGDGAMSAKEMSAFRDKMTAAMDQARERQGSESGAGMSGTGMPPMGPPPGPPPGESSSASGASDSSTDSTSSSAAKPKIDVHAFIEQLAARYASMAADSAGSTTGLVSTSA